MSVLDSFDTTGSTAPHSKQSAFILDGNHTDLMITEYENRVMVLVTQLQKMGTVVLVTNTAVMPVGVEKTEFNVNVLMGKDEPVTHVFARNLADTVFSFGNPKPILLSLALKEESPALMKTIQKILTEMKTSLR